MSNEIMEAIANLGYKTGSAYVLRGGKGESRTIHFGTFAGNASMTVWDANQKGAPAQSIPISRECAELMCSILEKLLNSQPSTPVTMEQMTYQRNPDGNGGKWVKDVVFRFVKSDKMTYTMELSSIKLTDPVIIPFMGNGAFMVGNEPLSESERSALRMKTFIRFLKYELPTLRTISLYNMKPRVNNGGNRGGYTPKAPSAGRPSYLNDNGNGGSETY